MNNDWVEKAAREAEQSDLAKKVRAVMAVAQPARATYSDYSAAASAKAFLAESYSVFDPMSAEQGLQAIIRTIRNAGTPEQIIAAGGEWITRVTIAISDETRKAVSESE